MLRLLRFRARNDALSPLTNTVPERLRLIPCVRFDFNDIRPHISQYLGAKRSENQA